MLQATLDLGSASSLVGHTEEEGLGDESVLSLQDKEEGTLLELDELLPTVSNDEEEVEEAEHQVKMLSGISQFTSLIVPSLLLLFISFSIEKARLDNCCCACCSFVTSSANTQRGQRKRTTTVIFDRLRGPPRLRRQICGCTLHFPWLSYA